MLLFCIYYSYLLCAYASSCVQVNVCKVMHGLQQGKFQGMHNWHAHHARLQCCMPGQLSGVGCRQGFIQGGMSVGSTCMWQVCKRCACTTRVPRGGKASSLSLSCGGVKSCILSSYSATLRVLVHSCIEHPLAFTLGWCMMFVVVFRQYYIGEATCTTLYL